MTKTIESNSLFEEPKATKLEELREIARAKRRLTYDCFNALSDAERVVCKKGHVLRGTQGVPLAFVMRGMSSGTCQNCPDYDDKDE